VKLQLPTGETAVTLPEPPVTNADLPVQFWIYPTEGSVTAGGQFTPIWSSPLQVLPAVGGTSWLTGTASKFNDVDFEANTSVGSLTPPVSGAVLGIGCTGEKPFLDHPVPLVQLMVRVPAGTPAGSYMLTGLGPDSEFDPNYFDPVHFTILVGIPEPISGMLLLASLPMLLRRRA